MILHRQCASHARPLPLTSRSTPSPHLVLGRRPTRMQVAHDKRHPVIWRGCALCLTQCRSHARTHTQAIHATHISSRHAAHTKGIGGRRGVRQIGFNCTGQAERCGDVGHTRMLLRPLSVFPRQDRYFSHKQDQPCIPRARTWPARELRIRKSAPNAAHSMHSRDLGIGSAGRGGRSRGQLRRKKSGQCDSAGTWG